MYSGMSEVPVLLIGFAIVCLYLEEMDTKIIEIWQMTRNGAWQLSS